MISFNIGQNSNGWISKNPWTFRGKFLNSSKIEYYNIDFPSIGTSFNDNTIQNIEWDRDSNDITYTFRRGINPYGGVYGIIFGNLTPIG